MWTRCWLTALLPLPLLRKSSRRRKQILNPIEDKDPLVEYYNQQIAAELNNLVANA